MTEVIGLSQSGDIYGEVFSKRNIPSLLNAASKCSWFDDGEPIWFGWMHKVMVF